MTVTLPYVTTYTGRHVGPEEGTPALLDIAVGLARICRFGGQGQRFFSVLAHTLWMDDLYQSKVGAVGFDLGRPLSPLVRLAILLHDASECIQSDVPSPMKTLDYKKQGYLLDQRIFDRFFPGGYEAYVGILDAEAPKSIVKHFDWRAMLAEYWTVGPAQPCYLEQPWDDDRAFLKHWIAEAGATLGGYRAGYRFSARAGFAASPTETSDIERHPAVREYVRRLTTLL